MDVSEFGLALFLEAKGFPVRELRRETPGSRWIIFAFDGVPPSVVEEYHNNGMVRVKTVLAAQRGLRARMRDLA